MKIRNILLAIVILLNVQFVYGQSENLSPSISPTTDPVFFDCYWCEFSNNDFRTGIKFGIGYGVLKELNELLDINATISINYWQTKYGIPDASGLYREFFQHKTGYVSLSVGERINLYKFNKSKLYTGVNLSGHIYTNTSQKLIGAAIEPNIGYSSRMGRNHEFYASIGYEQHIASYNRRLSEHPNKLSVVIGLNYKLEGQNKSTNNEK